jgi:hypothetical protein
MRIELAGSLIHPEPLVIRFDANQTFYPPGYIDLDFTHFEVICIGAGGGMGGGIDTANTGTLIRNHGGGGGGGGFHRVRGLLSALPVACAVVVGIGGALGTEHSSDPSQTTNGGDGGFSSFNGTTCQASGGKGGRRAQSNSTTVPTQADGGDGGIGNRTIAGGGGIGGVTTAPGMDGTLFSNVGKGGGGGAGGVALYGGGVVTPGTAGGRGAYNPGDTSVYGPGDAPDFGYVPGGGGGAKATPLNGLPTIYGQAYGQRIPGNNGVVILRLTAE